jgi:hypothetical protein
VLYDWHKAGRKDAVPWKAIKDGKIVSPAPTVQNPNARPPAVLQPVAVVVTPPMPPIAQGPSHSPPASTVSSKSVEIVEVVSDGEERRIKGKGKGKEVEATTSLIPKDAKCRKVSPQFVPVHHLHDEEPAPPSKRKKPELSRMTASYTPFEPDRLWKSLAERPTEMCTTCVTKHIACRTTAIQIACIPCHTGKTKCSYSAPHTARLKELQESGEIESPKASKRALAKKKQDDEEKVVKPRVKRKRQAEEMVVEDAAAEFVPPAAVAGPSNRPIIPTPSAGVVKVASAAPRPPPSTSIDTSTAPIDATPIVAAEAPPVLQMQALGALQQEVTDLRQLVAKMNDNNERLYQDNLKLRESVGVLLGWKEEMIARVPALEAEMRGLRNGMEWEKMRQDMASLRSELATTKHRLAEFEADTSEDDEDEGEKRVEEEAAPLEINLPRSSMFVHPSEMRVSIRATSTAARSSTPGERTDVIDPVLQSPVNASTDAVVSTMTNPRDENETSSATAA